AALQKLWPLLNGSVPIGQLWRVSDLDDYAVFQALIAAAKSKQIEEIQAPNFTPFQFLMNPLEMGPSLPLAPWDEISSLTVDPVSGTPSVKSGHLLGSLRPSDPWHLLHDLDLGLETDG